MIKTRTICDYCKKDMNKTLHAPIFETFRVVQVTHDLDDGSEHDMSGEQSYDFCSTTCLERYYRKINA